MVFSGFTNEDFDVFSIDGLESRMNALKTTVRPKLEALGQHFAPSLSVLTGQEMFPHVAKHLRRTIHPPNDTWVAFANNPRGYKMVPHFQIGLWETHLFIWFAVIYEYPHKDAYGQVLLSNLNSVYKNTPSDFVWSIDHTKPEVLNHEGMKKKDLESMILRLSSIKKAELLCGYQIPRDQAIKMNSEELLGKIEFVFQKLVPLFQLSQKSLSLK
jgi:uncharacterized protein YktB (UPF0637 family)